MILYNITRLYRDIRVAGNIRVVGDIRVAGDIKERMLYRKTLIDSYSKFKIRIIKNWT